MTLKIAKYAGLAVFIIMMGIFVFNDSCYFIPPGGGGGDLTCRHTIGKDISPLAYPLNYIVSLIVGFAFFLLVIIISWPIEYAIKNKLNKYALKGVVVAVMIAILKAIFDWNLGSLSNTVQGGGGFNIALFGYFFSLLFIVFIGFVLGIIYGKIRTQKPE